MNKKILIVLANYYKDISDGLLKSALKNISKSSKVKIVSLGFISSDKLTFLVAVLLTFRVALPSDSVLTPIAL